MIRRPRVHLAACEYCGRKIAWSRKRRQWLALAPITNLRDASQLQRRMRCPQSANRALHDPKVNALDFMLTRLRRGGAR